MYNGVAFPSIFCFCFWCFPHHDSRIHLMPAFVDLERRPEHREPLDPACDHEASDLYSPSWGASALTAYCVFAALPLWLIGIPVSNLYPSPTLSVSYRYRQLSTASVIVTLMATVESLRHCFLKCVVPYLASTHGSKWCQCFFPDGLALRIESWTQSTPRFAIPGYGMVSVG